MIAIIISACLAADPGVCRDYRIPLAQTIDMANCVAFAPPHFVKWAKRYPDWEIKRWRCTTSSVEDL